MLTNRPTNESAPYCIIASTISPRAPLPLSGRINAVGKAGTKSVFSPHNANNQPIPCTSRSIAPLARNIPTATSIAIRYGIIPTAVLNPSFAPSINASYTFTRFTIPAIINHTITPSSITAASIADHLLTVSCGRLSAPHITNPTNAVKPPNVPSTTLSKRFIFCATATDINPAMAAKYVASNMGRNTSAGLAAPSCARYVMIDTGTNVNPLVTSTRNIIIEFDALSFCLFDSCNSCIACSPSGVAALSIPSIVADRFISIDPKAG